MGLRSGLATQIGWAVEETVGTPETVTRFFEVNDESVKESEEVIKSAAMSAGRRTVQRVAYGLRQASGDVEYEVMPNGFGAIPPFLIGGTVATTTPSGATTARLHTTSAGSLDGKSRTLQIGRANNAGVVDPFTYMGVKDTDWALSMESGKDGLLMLKESVDCLDYSHVIDLATAVYPTENVLIPWSGAITLTIGGDEYDLSKLTIGGSNNLSDARTFIGSNIRKEQTEGDDFRTYPITFDVESYAGLDTGAQPLIDAHTEAAIVASFIGPKIETVTEVDFFYMIRVTLGRCIFEGDNPQVGGAGLVGQSITAEALFNEGGDDIKFEVQNTDVTA